MSPKIVLGKAPTFNIIDCKITHFFLQQQMQTKTFKAGIASKGHHFNGG